VGPPLQDTGFWELTTPVRLPAVLPVTMLLLRMMLLCKRVLSGEGVIAVQFLIMSGVGTSTTGASLWFRDIAGCGHFGKPKHYSHTYNVN